MASYDHSPLRIALDPGLVAAHGPEVHWVWRTLLAGIGWTWQEVPADAPCDIAYVMAPEQAPLARLVIQARPEAWARPAALRLAGVVAQNGLTHLRYVGDGLAPALRREGECLICEHDLAFDVFWLATGQEEGYWPRDRHGFYDLALAGVWREGILDQALASGIATWLERTLLGRGCPPPTPRWPEGKRAAATAGHDVDYPQVIRWLEPLRVMRRLGLSGLPVAYQVATGRRHHWHFHSWMALEQQLGLRSAFYFVPRQGSLWEYAAGTPDTFYDIAAPAFRRLFRELADAGFEVGLHASYWAYRDAEQFAREKRHLELMAGQPVAGNRHHYWHLNPQDVDQTLLIHEQLGLLYDTSLIHNRYLGWRRGLSQPFYPFHRAQRRELRTLQISPSWMDDQLFRMKADNPGDPFDRLCGLAERAAEQGGCLMVDVHEYVFDDGLFPGWARLYERLLEHLRERHDIWFAAPAQIARHWTARYQALLAASQGLRLGLPAHPEAILVD